MLRFFPTLILTLGLLPAESVAGRIYQFVDYPSIQEGFTLTGTINVADDASEDGQLMADELVDWSWSVTGPRTAQGNTQSDLLPPFYVSGIEIDADGIYLPLNQNSRLTLIEWTNAERNESMTALNWSTFDSTYEPDDFEGFRSQFYVYSRRNRDAFPWTTDGTLGGVFNSSTPWLIARAVPEPCSLALLLLVGLGCLHHAGWEPPGFSKSTVTR